MSELDSKGEGRERLAAELYLFFVAPAVRFIGREPGTGVPARREKVAAGYRILLMLGDDMGDFTIASPGSVAQRQAFAEAHHDCWGRRWITIAIALAQP